MKDLMKRLSDYGVPLKEVMERFVEDEEFYMECLNSFMVEESFEGLRSALEHANYQEAFDCAHNLKGVAGNMGVTPLYNAICNMVEPLRNKEYDQEHLKNLYDVIILEKEKLQQIVDGE